MTNNRIIQRIGENMTFDDHDFQDVTKRVNLGHYKQYRNHTAYYVSKKILVCHLKIPTQQ